MDGSESSSFVGRSARLSSSIDLVELIVAEVDATTHELVDELLVGLREEALEQRVPEPRERRSVRRSDGR